LVAISIQWVTAGEYCKVNHRSEKHWPRSQTKSGVHPHCGLRALEWRWAPHQRACPWSYFTSLFYSILTLTPWTDKCEVNGGVGRIIPQST
jgi:hypothetical protein